MLRSDIRDVLKGRSSRANFILKIKPETEIYRRNLGKSGSSCPIQVEGSESCQLSHSEVLEFAHYLDRHPAHVRDYILTAILLDHLIEKDEETIDLLEDLTAPEG